MTTLTNIQEEYEFLEADDRYRLLIELGRELAPMPAEVVDWLYADPAFLTKLLMPCQSPCLPALQPAASLPAAAPPATAPALPSPRLSGAVCGGSCHPGRHVSSSPGACHRLPRLPAPCSCPVWQSRVPPAGLPTV